MYYSWTPIVSTLFLAALLGNGQLVTGGRIPHRKPGASAKVEAPMKNGDHRDMVALPNLDILSKYVCSTKANTVKRQEIGPHITIPRDQLREFLQQIRVLELQTVALIDSILLGDGGNSSTVTLPPFTASSIPVASLSSVVNSALSTQLTTCSSRVATRTIRSTLTTTLPASTVTALLTSRMISVNLDVPRSTGECNSTTLTQSNVAAVSTATSTDVGIVETTITTTLDPETTTVIFIPTTGPTNSVSITASSVISPSSSLAMLSAENLLESTSTVVSATISSPLVTPSASIEHTASSSVPGGILLETSLDLTTPTSTPSTIPGATPLPAGPIRVTNPTDYVFDAASSKNVAVYFGQTPVTGGTSLEAQCADPNIDIAILSFVISLTGKYPTVNFGAACGGTTAKMAAEAPGLLSCPDLARNISNCQTIYGKKVLLSIGGATSRFPLSSPAEATTFAETLWNLFGPAGNIDNELRPFGTVSIDGFDIDKEDRLPANWDALASSLRTLYATTTTKKYYLSSAPQCPFPDLSTPSGLILLCDFVFVQFYNNPACEIGSSGFAASVRQWSESLAASTMASQPKLYIGAPAFSAAGPSAYASLGSAEGIRDVVVKVKEAKLGNLGGVVLWDGPEGMLNKVGGKDIITYAKEGLVL